MILPLLLAASLFASCPIFSQPGSLDITYGIGGKVTNNLGENAQAYDSVLQADGKLIVVGDTYSIAPGSSFLISRYLTDGSLDTTFNGSGYTSLLARDHAMASGVAVQSDGKIVVVGTAMAPGGTGSNSSDMMVVRLNADGSLDTSFGDSGIQVVVLPYSQNLRDVLIQSDGKIVAGGLFTWLSNPNADTPGLIRFNANGSIDTSYGENGYVYTPGVFRGEITKMHFAEDESIVALGRTFIINNYLILKYDSNGSLINSFGPNGTGIVQVPITEGNVGNFTFAPDGSFYGGGAIISGNKTNTFVTKYFPNGTIDHSFADNGKLIKDIGIINGIDYLSGVVDLALDKNNQLLLGLSCGIGTNYDFGLLSYSPEGVLNTAFGNNGLFITNFGAGHDYFETMVVQEDNKIILIGNKGLQVLARINNASILSTDSAVANAAQIYISPNPVNDDTSLVVALQKQTVISSELVDSKGTFIGKIHTDINYPAGKHSDKMNLQQFHLDRGIYFLKIYTDGKYLKTIKIVK